MDRNQIRKRQQGMTTAPIRFETLLDRYHDEIYAYLWRLLNGAGRPDSAVEAQDLAQEVFLRAYQAFDRLRPDSNPRAWLYKIASNCAYTALRRGQRRAQRNLPLQEELLAIPDPHSPAREVDLKETMEQIARAIATLPPKQRVAVVLRHVQGLDYGAIAEVLHCSPDSARANVYQALRRLRRVLDKAPA